MHRESAHKIKRRKPAARIDRTETETGRSAVLLEFSAKEFPHYPKNQLWYLGVGLLLFSVLTLALREGNYSLALVMVALGLAIFRLADLHPQTKAVRLTVRGVYWGDRFFPYHRLRSFWITEVAGLANLYIDQLNLSPTIHLIIPGNQTEQAGLILGSFLPWHDHKVEPLADRLNRWLRL